MIYPIALVISGWPVLIVGGGKVAERRVQGLLEAAARVHIVALKASPLLQDLATEQRLQLDERAYLETDLDGKRLVIAATDDEHVNHAIVHQARARGILVNDAADAANGDFRVPAIHRVGSLTFAVETGGSSPTFARQVREQLAHQFGAAYGEAAETLRSLRAIVAACVPMERRAAVMETLAALPIDRLAAMDLSTQENLVEMTLLRDQQQRDALSTSEIVTRVCATRRSPLALVQSRAVAAQLALHHISTSLLEISSIGDERPRDPLASLGSGIFVHELEKALIEQRADYAVHSCKDLPSQLPAGLTITAVPVRADARDAFCSEKYASLDLLPSGASVGTSSPRRIAQVLALRPDLLICQIRGNIDTRLARLRDGTYDAVILAMAGLERLKQRASYVVPLPVEMFIPAVAQGALAIETRTDDPAWCAQLRAALNDPYSELAVIAERAFLAEVHGGCHAPIGAYAAVHAVDTGYSELRLQACIYAPSGLASVRGEERLMVDNQWYRAESEHIFEQARALGISLARRLLDEGGRVLLTMGLPLQGRRIVIGRTQERMSRIALALRAQGAHVLELGLDTTLTLEVGQIDAILFPSSASVAVVAEHIDPHTLRDTPVLIAAMGPQSATAASIAGFVPQLVAPQPEVGIFVHAITQALLEQE